MVLVMAEWRASDHSRASGVALDMECRRKIAFSDDGTIKFPQEPCLDKLNSDDSQATGTKLLRHFEPDNEAGLRLDALNSMCLFTVKMTITTAPTWWLLMMVKMVEI